ncbi:MAG: hypothetical protein ACOCYT_02010 [Chloroflexota bacterium]
MTFIKLERRSLTRDLISGLTGAVAGAPQAMGFALIETRLANVFAGAFIAVTLIAFGSIIERIALAAHLITAAIGLISPHQIRLVWQARLAARAAMSTTFISALIFRWNTASISASISRCCFTSTTQHRTSSRYG